MAEQNPEPEAEEGTFGRKKLTLIIIAALVLLLGGGAAAYFLMGDDAPAVAEQDGQAAEEEEEESEGIPTYHELKPAFVVNLPPGGSAKMLQVGVQLSNEDPSIVEVITAHEPMLRHHLFDVLSSQTADALNSRAGREQLQTQVKEELISKLKEVGATKRSIKSVYFTQFVLQ